MNIQSSATPSNSGLEKPTNARLLAALFAGAAVGILGGLVGLGGAEFRLPILIGLFGFGALSAVILNKATSLVVVASALLFRASAVPIHELVDHWAVAVNLLCGSLLGAWLGASWTTRVKSRTLYKTLAGMLLLIAAVLVLGDERTASTPLLTGAGQWVAGVAAGFGIGVVASIMGVAGGELLIPTLVILFGLHIKLAGSMSLAISLPTMLVAFFRYSRDQAFEVVRSNTRFVAAMAIGSVLGTSIGSRLLGVVPSEVLLPLLALILVVSAFKVWQHR